MSEDRAEKIAEAAKQKIKKVLLESPVNIPDDMTGNITPTINLRSGTVTGSVQVRFDT